MNIIKCRRCGYQDKEDTFPYGRGRQWGTHPDHRYCPRCGQSIDWFGYWVVAVVAEGEEEVAAREKQAA